MKKFLKRAGITLLVLFAALYGFYKIQRARSFQLLGEVVPRVETQEKVVALTFDDGPTAQATAEVLQVLKEENVKASFFLIGAEMEQHPELARQIVAEGHELGNHTYTHDRMVFKTPSFIREQIEKTDLLIREAGYAGDIHVRSPYCSKFLLFPYYLSKTNRKNITFDVEPETYAEIDGNAERMIEHVLANTRPGSIILLHVMYPSRKESLRAVRGIVQGLKEQGYEFKTVSELLALRG